LFDLKLICSLPEIAANGAAVSAKYFPLIKHGDAARSESQEPSTLPAAFCSGAGGMICSGKSVSRGWLIRRGQGL
jgi:hypothetical protein